MKQKIFEVGKKAYTFNQARYEEDMGRCVITAVSERYITDDIGNKFTVSSDDRDYLTAEGNRTLRLYVSEKEALEDLECIRITNWINQHMKKLPSGSLKQLQLIIKCLENQDITIRIYAAEGFSYHKGIEAPTKWVFAVSGAIEKAAYKGCFSLLLTYYFGL